MLVEREATHRAIALSELVDVPILIVHVSGREAVEQIRWARGARPARLRRDLPAVPVPHRRRPRTRRLRGRQVRLQPAAARPGQPAGDLGRSRPTACSPSSRPTTRRSASTTRRARSRAAAKCAFQHIPNGIPGLETRLPLLFSEGVRRGRITLNQFVALTATNPAQGSTACIRARARSRSAPTPTS